MLLRSGTGAAGWESELQKLFYQLGTPFLLATPVQPCYRDFRQVCRGPPLDWFSRLSPGKVAGGHDGVGNS
jgi:hypothetical protein